MARSVDQAFDELLTRLTPTATESGMAASHRSSIEQCLKGSFGMTNFFRSGSFGYGTSVSGYSDVDYFAVIPPSRLTQNSQVTLENIATALRTRFPLTNIKIESPAVVIPFGTTLSERHEIIPAYLLSNQSSFQVYQIPDRIGGWMSSSPDFYAAYIDAVDAKRAKKVKPLIRLIKAWKYFSGVPVRSFYLEMKVAQYADTQNTIIYRIDVQAALNHLVVSRLENLPDPLVRSPIYAAFSGSEIQTVLAKAQSALPQANVALQQEHAGNIANAFRLWDQVFNGKFPAYY